MSKNIFEPRYDIATPIAGLTCKPLSILPETISPQEMSLARGGFDGSGPVPQEGQDPAEADREKAEAAERRKEAKKLLKDQNPDMPGLGPLGGTFVPNINVAGSPDQETFWTSADSSGTQDLNGGALDNVEEEDDYYDLIDPDDYEDWEYFVDEWDTEEGSSGYEGVDVPEQMFQ